MRLRGLTQEEITRELPNLDPPIFNPDTNRPYDLAQINRDLKHIEAEWKAETLRDAGELRGAHVAELKEVRRSAWQNNKLFYILKSLEQEAHVLGLEGATGEDIAAKLRAYLDMVDAAKKDAEDLSERA